jgi:hypothetical protein
MHLASSLLLGLDSALCCLAVGAIMPSVRQRLGLALAFGLCDGIASIAGSMLASPFAEPSDAAIYLCCAAVLGLAARYWRPLVFALPVLMSIDNLVSGGNPGDAFLNVATSAALALVGLHMGVLVRARVAGQLRFGA